MQPGRAGLRRLGRGFLLLWRADHRATLVLIGGHAVQGSLPVCAAWFTKQVVDELTQPRGSGPALARAVAGLVVVIIFSQAAPALDFVRGNLSRAVEREVQSKLVATVNAIRDLTPFETPGFHDRLRVASEAGVGVPAQLTNAAPVTIAQTVTITGFVLAVWAVNPLVASLGLLSAVPALVAQLRLSRARVALADTLSPAERRRTFYTSMQTDERAAKEIRLFGLGTFFLGRMLGELATIHAGQRRVDRREAQTQVLLGVLAGAVAGSAIAVIAMQADQGRLSAGGVVLLLAMVTSLQSAAAQMTLSASILVECSLLLGRYEVFIAEARGLADPPGGRTVPPLVTAITFEKVWFRYRDDLPWVLRGVDMVIEHGKATGLVGLNGAGKSTLIKILCGLYTPTRGRVLWDGVDIADFDRAALHRRISAVFQDFMSYDLSAAENVGLGDLGNQQRIALDRAAETGGAAELVRDLPKGWETLLSRLFLGGEGGVEEGTTLSGGQWQRLATARMCLRIPNDLIVLDEPTSGLDARAEHGLHQRLAVAADGCTRLIISHRLNTVRDVDTILVIDGGRVVESGTHEDLVAASGQYATLFSLQAAGYVGDGDSAPRSSATGANRKLAPS